MNFRPAHLSLALLLALGLAAGAHAQSRTEGGQRGDQAVLPIVNSGRLEGFLLLEPADATWRSGDKTLDAAFGLDGGDSLGLLCDKVGVASALVNLTSCQVASFDETGSQRTGAIAAFSRGGTRLGFGAGSNRDTLPAWLTSGNARGPATRVDSNDLTLFAQKRLGREGMVSIAGTLAKAKVMTPAEASTLGLPDNWTSKRLSLGGSVGNFGASIVGHVVETPGQPRWEGLGVGLTWRTPWSGQLTVGAENLVTKGKNPFSLQGETADEEGTIPYVRYEQDL